MKKRCYYFKFWKYIKNKHIYTSTQKNLRTIETVPKLFLSHTEQIGERAPTHYYSAHLEFLKMHLKDFQTKRYNIYCHQHLTPEVIWMLLITGPSSS